MASPGRNLSRSNESASQTLVVLSFDPDTIFVPSGENATELMGLLWAFVFSLSSPSAPAGQAKANRHKFWPRGNFEIAVHLNPRL
jgi:hypothetical protein